MSVTLKRKRTFWKFCRLFCCPPLFCLPCPELLTSKLAFKPPNPSYELKPFCSSFEEFSLLGSGLRRKDLERVEGFYAYSTRGNRIACLFIRGPDSPEMTILYSHGNGTDLGIICHWLLQLSTEINCNVLSYDYSGYGASSGKPSEKNLYTDIDAAWTALRHRYGAGLHNTVLYGSNLGSVPTVDLAARTRFRGVVLQSALLSGIRTLCPTIKTTLKFDTLRNIDKFANIKSPTLVIHGTDDEIVDFSCAKDIHQLCPCAVEPVWIQGAGHNGIEQSKQFRRRLHTFMHNEI